MAAAGKRLSPNFTQNQLRLLQFPNQKHQGWEQVLPL